MRFKNNTTYQMSGEKFLGVDLSAPDGAMLTGSAAMAENVFVNNSGELEKRRGYELIYKTDKEVNGVYEYGYKPGCVIYILHEADKLYELKKTESGFEVDKEIYSGIANKESEGFCFGGALFIMCSGYYKICYDEFFERIAVARVKDAFTKNEVQCVTENRSKGEFDGENIPFINKEYMYHSIKFKYDKYYFDEVEGDVNKLYIAKNEYENMFRVVSLNIDGMIVDCYQYKIKSDQNGIYITLKRTNTNYKSYYKGVVEIVLCYTGFVYAPKFIVSRPAVGIKNLGSSLADGFTQADCFGGVYTEDLNLASPVRKVNFYINLQDFESVSYIRCYLEDKNKKGDVLKVTAGGQVIHNYDIQKDAYGTEQVVFSYLSEYVDFKKNYLKTFASSSEIIVEVEYTASNFESQIDDCDIYGFFDGANDLRVFVSGNEKYPARDYSSGIYDASYFPELMYTTVGSEVSKILGYGRYFGYQLIFKDSKGDAEIYFRTSEDGVFKIVKGASSQAAAGKRGVINMSSYLFFLSETGLYSVDATAVEGQSKTTLRSKAINPLLLKEDLSSVRMAKSAGKLMLFSEKYVYVLDIERGFLWYIFSFPQEVRRATSLAGEVILYKNAIAKIRQEEDEALFADEKYDGTNQNVFAYWKTNNVCFAPFKRRDILSAYCSLSEFDNGNSAEILYNSEDFLNKSAKKGDYDLFSFNDLDFSRFSFRCIREGLSVISHLRAKRVEKLSLTLKNDENRQMKINKIGFLYR